MESVFDTIGLVGRDAASLRRLGAVSASMQDEHTVSGSKNPEL